MGVLVTGWQRMHTLVVSVIAAVVLAGCSVGDVKDKLGGVMNSLA
jgi:hypothetical protein